MECICETNKENPGAITYVDKSMRCVECGEFIAGKERIGMTDGEMLAYVFAVLKSPIDILKNWDGEEIYEYGDKEIDNIVNMIARRLEYTGE